jgi:rhodanese-related sulfurtransferase
MGNTLIKGHTINFEDMQFAINEQNKHLTNTYQERNVLIINTLNNYHQDCLISGTVAIDSEVEIINAHLKKNKDIKVIIYGMNSCDETCFKKYEQLMKLGFYNVYIYVGGLFEWLLLQDIYGTELFSTTSVSNIDILKYKGRTKLNMRLLEN